MITAVPSFSPYTGLDSSSSSSISSSSACKWAWYTPSAYPAFFQLCQSQCLGLKTALIGPLIGVRGLPHHIDANLLPGAGFCSTLGTDPQILQGLAGHGLGKCHGAELLLPLKMVFSIVCLILCFLSSFLPGSCGTCNVCCLHPRPLER